ncbi:MULTISPECIES: hypothetical protein [unclassified Polaromonas]|uniref:hypothetical protein n=1 Tax=unclassified Polaromonas TaxID=2638319 RepID=UPI0018CB1653|nr:MULTISPECIES: hypothetical protein [unclassified Polaromonas]MBG6073399.1 hypothetical protein [Polaromonas sp. CG_9.7]MBG6115416.1 hypothetical protein [Polaromonas sp. CG_9.2]MDH6186120.1 hypothetical protein [Polaromonas sp. CG_23.6]
MPLNTTPPFPGSYLPNKAVTTDLKTEYAHLRDELERLLTEPDKDFQRIDALVDQLELVQLAFKEQHGIKGNNPNE